MKWHVRAWQQSPFKLHSYMNLNVYETQNTACAPFPSENPIFIDNFIHTYCAVLGGIRFYLFTHIYLFMNVYACVNDFTQLFCKYWSSQMIAVVSVCSMLTLRTPILFYWQHRHGLLWKFPNFQPIYFESSEKSKIRREKLDNSYAMFVYFFIFSSWN